MKERTLFWKVIMLNREHLILFWMRECFLGCFLGEKVLNNLIFGISINFVSIDLSVFISRRICPVTLL